MTSPFLQEPLDLLFYWVIERESIRAKRAAGEPWPWTKDKIMGNTRWCNTRRADDRVSMWLWDSWYCMSEAYGKRGKTSPAQRLANVGMARLINWPETLGIMAEQGLNTSWHRQIATNVLQGIQARERGKVFTGAYIINGIAGQSKITTVVNQFDALYNSPHLVDSMSMERTHKNLQGLLGFGSFISGQVVADLRFVWPGPWADRHTWAPLGPGSRRGLAWLLGWNGTDQLNSMKQSTFNALLAMLRLEFDRRVPHIMADRQLEAHDLQNCLCEFDKMSRLTHSTGRAKNKFNGATR